MASVQGISNLVAEFGCVAASRNAGSSERNAFNYGNVLPLIKIIQQLSEDSRFTEVLDTTGGQSINAAKTWDAPLQDEVDYILVNQRNSSRLECSHNQLERTS